MKSIATTLVLLLMFSYLAICQSSYIQIVCEPEVAVLLDGKMKGFTSQQIGGYILEGVTPGKHKVTLRKSGHAIQTGLVSLKDGEVFTYYSSPFIPKVSIAQKGAAGSDEISIEKSGLVKTG